jgi:hypothetical protein
VVGPRAAFVIVREVGDQVERLAAALASSHVEENRVAAAELQRAMDSMREAARQRREREVGGSAERTTEPVGAESRGASSCPPWWLGSRGVAERLGVSTEYVARLCRRGDLSGVQQGRAWAIDPESVALYEAARRPVA